MKEYDFYIVPTPIGNLGDITLRAIEVLKSVDLIACEDSRVTQKLLNHYDIRTKCLSYHKYNEKERVQQIVKLLEAGQKIALVSDAGTPLICDPGCVIVKELRQRGFRVTSLPGANAVVTFLSQISRSDEQFSFVGFLPKTENKIQKLVKDYDDKDFVFYESPNRIIQTLKIIKSVRPEAKISIGRELTKIFEEILTDNVDNIIKHFEQNIPRGEFVVIVFRQDNLSNKTEICNKVKILQDKGFSPKDISLILSELYGYNKNEVYKISIGK
ncbi:16S rRNA (cytidine(1402)-2'-O)-methyltransferase [bacterium]|nr:16S rRNA (cytidine(1402)-2'-O)-methyltransferase [bacterium]